MFQVINPDTKDLGGFEVRRALPSPMRKAVGPFVFFDHMGPATFAPGDGIQVRPHPHIGLATVTYLFEGEIIHRDNLGFVQPIKPGAVNLMTAGRGIVHSERAGEDLHETSSLHGIQSWMALPMEEEECEPSFQHFPENEIPEVRIGPASVRIVMGHFLGQRSPVSTKSPTLYLECRLPAGSHLEIPGDWSDLAAYIVSGRAGIDEAPYDPFKLVIMERRSRMRLEALKDSHVMVLGGDPLGERMVWWNLVSSVPRRIQQAKDDWKAGRFDRIPGESEFIPLPED